MLVNDKRNPMLMQHIKLQGDYIVICWQSNKTHDRFDFHKTSRFLRVRRKSEKAFTDIRVGILILANLEFLVVLRISPHNLSVTFFPCQKRYISSPYPIVECSYIFRSARTSGSKQSFCALWITSNKHITTQLISVQCFQ